jgi:hypothetical protein
MQLLIECLDLDLLVDILSLKLVYLFVVPRELSLHEILKTTDRLTDLVGVLAALQHRCQVRIDLDLVHLVVRVNLSLVEDVLAVDRHIEGLLDNRAHHILQRSGILIMDDCSEWLL